MNADQGNEKKASPQGDEQDGTATDHNPKQVNKKKKKSHVSPVAKKKIQHTAKDSKSHKKKRKELQLAPGVYHEPQENTTITTPNGKPRKKRSGDKKQASDRIIDHHDNAAARGKRRSTKSKTKSKAQTLVLAPAIDNPEDQSDEESEISESEMPGAVNIQHGCGHHRSPRRGDRDIEANQDEEIQDTPVEAELATDVTTEMNEALEEVRRLTDELRQQHADVVTAEVVSLAEPDQTDMTKNSQTPKNGSCPNERKHKKIYYFILVSLLLIIGLGVGLSSGQKKNNGDGLTMVDDTEAQAPDASTSPDTSMMAGQGNGAPSTQIPGATETNPPSPLPTIVSISQLGLDIDGKSVNNGLGGFGNSVATSSDGNRIVVGTLSTSLSLPGYVQVFEWTGSQWQQLGEDIAGEAFSDFHVAMSSDGNRIIAGDLKDDGMGLGAGHVRIFEWTDSQWQQVGEAIDGDASDSFGCSVAISSEGGRIVVGATGNGAGYVRIFEWTGTLWQQVGTDINGEAADDKFGDSVAMSSDGNCIVVGAPYNDDNGNSSGHAQVFEWNGSQWNQLGRDIEGLVTNDKFGTAVAMSSDGTRIAVAGRVSEYNDYGAGYVQALEWTGNQWQPMGLNLTGFSSDDGFGQSVAMSSDGNRIAVGADSADPQYVRIFDWGGSEWKRIGSDVVADSDAHSFGSSLAMPSFGSRIVVGADSSQNEDGFFTGQVQVFEIKVTQVGGIGV